MPQPNPSLKARNFKWLCALAATDAVGVFLLAFPVALRGVTLSQATLLRAALSVALPVIVMILAALLPTNAKIILVYWRFKYALPGHRAFSTYALGNGRIDVAALKKHVGEFPTNPTEQDALWFKLYKQVTDDVTVIDAHSDYLRFRDMAAISFLLLTITPVWLYFADVTVTSIAHCTALIGVQYFVTALASRNSGVRLVINVLALHSNRVAPAK